MGLIAQIALGVLAISFMTFVAFFGRLPALRHTPVAWLHRALMVHTPNAILRLDRRFAGGRLASCCADFGHQVMYGKHPTVLIFFFLLLSVGEYLYVPGAWPRLSAAHKVCGTVAMALPYLFLYLSAYTDPGYVTPATHARHMAQYPYDFSLFHPGQVCRTCNLVKPARSKHCAVCKRCVAKMDHHCIFINNCVGHANHGYFLLLLLTTGVLTAYGAALGLHLVSASVRQHFPAWSLWKPAAFGWRDYFVHLTFGLQRDVGLGSVALLALLTSPLVWGLLAYHLYLVYCGTTTNESMKWQDWKAEMEDGFAFKRRLRDPRWGEEPARTRWPVESIQVLVRTEDGDPPTGGGGGGAPGEGDWERVWKLADVENLYDLGFWDNLVDVLLPGHSFRREVVTDEERGRRSRKPKQTKASRIVDAAT